MATLGFSPKCPARSSARGPRSPNGLRAAQSRSVRRVPGARPGHRASHLGCPATPRSPARGQTLRACLLPAAVDASRKTAGRTRALRPGGYRQPAGIGPDGRAVQPRCARPPRVPGVGEPHPPPAPSLDRVADGGRPTETGRGGAGALLPGRFLQRVFEAPSRLPDLGRVSHLPPTPLRSVSPRIVPGGRHRSVRGVPHHATLVARREPFVGTAATRGCRRGSRVTEDRGVGGGPLSRACPYRSEGRLRAPGPNVGS